MLCTEHHDLTPWKKQASSQIMTCHTNEWVPNDGCCAWNNSRENFEDDKEVKPDKSKHKVDMSDDLSSWLYILILLRLSHVYSKPDKSKHKVDKET
jgi:hypothetical protein